MQGFFQSLQMADTRPPVPPTPRCGQCGLYLNCQSPKMLVFGKGLKKIFIVGEAPGEKDDEQGQTFIGESGDKLRGVLDKAGVDLDRDCWIGNSLRCHPENNKIPNPKMIDWCRPFTVNDIKELKPETIILLGASAVKSVIGWLWREDVGAISRWVGLRIPSIALNAYVCPTWHPSYIMRTENSRENEIAGALFEKHIAAAAKLQKRPWKEIPCHNASISCVYDHEQAAALLDRLTESGRPVAWDIETNMLKPDNPEARIVSCSFSDGTTAFSFPWIGLAVVAAKRLLTSNVPKIGWNLAFETNWLKTKEGIDVNHWIWDGMLAAHLLNTTPDTKSLKFQAFATLGVDAWDAPAAPYLRADGSNIPNCIHEMPLDKLLTYGAYDSLYTYLICKKQMKRMGRTL